MPILLVCLGHSALRGGYVRVAAIVQKGGQSNAGTLVIDRGCCEAEFRGRLSDQNRNGVFELRSLHGDIRVLYASGVQLGLRLRYVGLRATPPLKRLSVSLQVCRYRPLPYVEKLFLSVGAAQFEIVQGEFRLEAELSGLIVGSGSLALLPARQRRCAARGPRVSS